MTNIYIILRNGELYHGRKQKPKSVKAFTSRGVAEGVIKRDIGNIASEMYHRLDIKPKLHDYESEVFLRFVDLLEKEFEIKEVEL